MACIKNLKLEHIPPIQNVLTDFSRKAEALVKRRNDKT